MNLRETILSEKNIYNAIYALNSYISERNLLSKEDLILYEKLTDKFDFEGTISHVISECKKILNNILDTKNLFEVSVFFKIKKFDEEENIVKYRPLHTSSLINQICMASMLIPLMFDDSDGTRKYSELSKMLPHNFYGNIPSENVDILFKKWSDKYRQYTDNINDKCREYSRTREYDKEINFDLKDFFPSINPSFIFDYIIQKLQHKYDLDDIDTLKRVVTKLLYFTIKQENLDGWTDVYYPSLALKDNTIPEIFVNRGIAQGLPQSYFFGNLCMITVAETMSSIPELKNSNSFFYVDDSVVFTKNISEKGFNTLITKLNNKLKEKLSNINCPPKDFLNENYYNEQCKILYNVTFHEKGKSSICDIGNSFNGLEYLFLVQRPVSLGGWIKGNIDEVDDHVSLKKLIALQEVVDNQIKRAKEEKCEENQESYQTRLKWLYRYRKYFILRQRKLKMLINGKFDPLMIDDFYNRFKFKELRKLAGQDENLLNVIKDVFEVFEEEIFSAEIELIAKGMPLIQLKNFCDEIKNFENALTKYKCPFKRNKQFLYYHKIVEALKIYDIPTIDKYASLCSLIKHIFLYKDSKVFLDTINKNHDINEFNFWKLININGNTSSSAIENTFIGIPIWADFIFNNSNEFKRMILNCCFSAACRIPVNDNMTLLRIDIKPVRYYEMRILAMLRNYHFNVEDFFEFLRSLDHNDLNERMDIDLGILEALCIFRQKIQTPRKVDRMILTHRVVKSLWHNGSKFLNAYTLHNQEHAVTLVKNVVRLVNNIDFLNLKSNDYFLLFQACYLHDISMVIHPKLASFNECNPKAEHLISNWMYKMTDIKNKVENAFKNGNFSQQNINQIRKNIGYMLLEAYEDVFNFFETKVRNSHPQDSANYIRNWHKGILSFLSELEAETIAKVSDSHGWDSTDVYTQKSSAKDELVSIKYMMILIRMADLLDLANDRIDYHILKQNRSQMGLISRFHWISHLITDGFKLDVDYITDDVELYKHPIKENIHLDIFLNTDLMSTIEVNKKQCKNYISKLKTYKISSNPYEINNKTSQCIEFSFDNKDVKPSSSLCNQSINGNCICPFLCLWMSKKHEWLFNEIFELKNYLNSVNSELITSDFTLRFYMSNSGKLDSEFYDDVKEWISKEH